MPENQIRDPSSSGLDSSLPTITMDRFSCLIESIYDTVSDLTNWPVCLNRILIEFHANYTSLIVRLGSVHDLGFVISASNSLYLDPVNGTPIAMSPFSGLRSGRVTVISDILALDDWRKMQYYKDYCEPHDIFHIMAVNIDIPNMGPYGLRIMRSSIDPPFSCEDRSLCEKIVPHLKRSLTLQATLNQDQKISGLYRRGMEQLMVGVFILDERGMIIETNLMADAIVQRSDGLSISSNKLCATYSADNKKLQQLIQKVLIQRDLNKPMMIEAIAINRPSCRSAWGLIVQSIPENEWTEGKRRPCVAVFLRDSESKSEPPLQLVQKLFELTPAETALAIQLANGLSLDEASDMLNIRYNTARAHLRSIFSKTGVRRQTELVRIFLNSVVALGG